MADDRVWTMYDVAGSESWQELGATISNALEDGTREWRGELGEVSEDAIVWQPFEGSHSIGGLLLHIADVEIYWLQQVLGGRDYPAELRAKLLSEETDQDSVKWPTPPRMPLTEYYAMMDEIRATTLDVLSQPFDPLKVHENPSWFSRFTNRWVLSHALTHESYHGGQAVLLGLMFDRMAR